MSTLFGPEPVLPNGFSYLPDFITSEEENQLMEIVTALSLQPLKFQGFEAKRLTASYGVDYHFDTRDITKGKAIPQEFNFLIQKVASRLAFHADDFAEVLVTEYPVGSVINWHRDGPPFEVIAGISLASDCTFRFRPYDKAKQNRKSIITRNVARRSLYVIRGEAREDWEHSIQPVTEVRFSITLRTLKREAGF